jgi:hypothetical protein
MYNDIQLINARREYVTINRDMCIKAANNHDTAWFNNLAEFWLTIRDLMLAGF